MMPRHNAKTLGYELYHADALEWLKGRRPCSVHAVVTDPPYGWSNIRPTN